RFNRRERAWGERAGGLERTHRVAGRRRLDRLRRQIGPGFGRSRGVEGRNDWRSRRTGARLGRGGRRRREHGGRVRRSRGVEGRGREGGRRQAGRRFAEGRLLDREVEHGRRRRIGGGRVVERSQGDDAGPEGGVVVCHQPGLVGGEVVRRHQAGGD